jgi:O-antigen/teichoic acid export membrane protein
LSELEVEENQPQRALTPADVFNARRFGGDAALVMGAGAVANIFSYAFHFLISRQLGPERYGTLVTLMAVAMMVGVLGSAMGTVAMQETARMWASHLQEAIGPFSRRAGRLALLVALLIACGLVALSFIIGPYVHVSAFDEWLVLAIYVAVAVLAVFARGIAQGAHRFHIFAASLVSEGVAKVVISCGLVALSFGVVGALGGLLASSFIALAIAYAPMAVGGPDTWREGEPVRLGGETLKVLGVTAATNALLFIDMLFAKHHFSGAVAGYFGAAGTLSRTLPFGIVLIAMIIMPKAAAALHQSRAALARVLGIAAAGAGAAVIGGGALLVVLGAPIIALTFGRAFTPAASFVRWYALDEALLALWLMAISYLVAVSRYEVFPYLLTALVAEGLCFAFFGSTPLRLLAIAIVANAMLIPVAWTMALRTLRHAPQASDQARDETMKTRSNAPASRDDR